MTPIGRNLDFLIIAPTPMSSSLTALAALRFAFHMHGLATYPSGATFGPRTLRDYEFVWIVDGDCVWECDGVLLPAPPGTVLLGRPGMRDAFRWDAARQTRHGYFHFAIDALPNAFPSPETWPLLRHLPADDIIRPLFHHLAWLLGTRGPGWEELAQGALRQALGAFISGTLGSAGEDDDRRHPVIERVLAQVQRAWVGGRLRSVALPALARAAQMSPAHLSRVFRAELGVSPVAALRLMRLDRAAQLLARTNAAINDIAQRCGFDNAFHFSRAFRNAYRCSPRDFRRRLIAGQDMPTTKLVQVRKLSARLWRT